MLISPSLSVMINGLRLPLTKSQMSLRSSVVSHTSVLGTEHIPESKEKSATLFFMESAHWMCLDLTSQMFFKMSASEAVISPMKRLFQDVKLTLFVQLMTF